MGKKIIVALIMTTMLIGGCGKKEAEEVPAVQEETVAERASTSKPVYELKSTDDIKNEEPVESSSPINDGFDPNRLSQIEPPTKYVMDISIGYQGSNINLLVGECDNYQLTGTSSAFIWESENGTFYKSGDTVYKVEVNGRSKAFEDDSLDMNADEMISGFGEDTDSETDDSTDLDIDEDDVQYYGIQEVGSRDCYVFDITQEDENGNESTMKFGLDINDYSIRKITGEQDGMTIDVVVYDYIPMLSEFENSATETIDDETASSNVSMAVLGSMFQLMGSAMTEAE